MIVVLKASHVETLYIIDAVGIKKRSRVNIVLRTVKEARRRGAECSGPVKVLYGIS